jgi:periplasmic mercuric ion binding protein
VAHSPSFSFGVKKQAAVTFDDTKTDSKALVKATTDAGYPSQPEGEKK